MLAVARKKLPILDARFGALEALPLPDESVDLVVCALALTHVDDLNPVMTEFARVVRPRGRVVLSDVHPTLAMLGGEAVFQSKDDTAPAVHFVPNIVHQISEYIAAFRAAGFKIDECTELVVNESMLANFPSWEFSADATQRAFLGLPFVLIWNLQAP